MTNQTANQIQDTAKALTDNANEQLQTLQTEYWIASNNLNEAKFASRFEQIEAIKKLSQLGLALDATAKAYKAINIARCF
jgi:excinuclease UvrABC nuclease subunit